MPYEPVSAAEIIRVAWQTVLIYFGAFTFLMALALLMFRRPGAVRDEHADIVRRLTRNYLRRMNPLRKREDTQNGSKK